MTVTGAGPGATSAVDQLLGRLADDLDEGFVELVRGYQRPVYSVALRLTDQPCDAEDLAAEAFLRAYRALRDFDSERIARLQPRPWLMTIVLNVWRNTVRGRSRRPEQLSLGDLAELESAELDIQARTELNEQRRELARQVARLPAAQRAAVVLRHVVDLPIPEIAAAMNCPEGTVKSHISRGLRRLRANYLADGQDGPRGPAATPAPAGVPVGRRVQR